MYVSKATCVEPITPSTALFLYFLSCYLSSRYQQNASSAVVDKSAITQCTLHLRTGEQASVIRRTSKGSADRIEYPYYIVLSPYGVMISTIKDSVDVFRNSRELTLITKFVSERV